MVIKSISVTLRLHLVESSRWLDLATGDGEDDGDEDDEDASRW